MVKRGGKWLTPEYCESMMKKEELDEQFFDDDAVIPSIAIFSYEPAPPDARSLRTESKERKNCSRL